jgi:hypothetical protein
MWGGRYLIPLILLNATAAPTLCQSLGPGSAGFGVSLAATEYQIREEALNAIRHRGASLTLGFFRQGGDLDRRHRITLSVLVAGLSDRYAPERGSLVAHPELDLRMGWRVTPPGRGTAFFVGGTAGWSTHWAFYEQWDETHVYWLTSSQLGVDALVEHHLARGRSLHLEVDAPLLALVSRPPSEFSYREVNPALGWILGEVHGKPRLASPADHLALNLGLVYSRTGEGGLRHEAFVQMEYIRDTTPSSRPVTILTYRLGISMPIPF